MQLTKFRILSAITVGSLALAVVATTVSSGASPAATHAALAAQTESFPPVNLDDCPILHPGYPTGECVAQLQTDLNIIQDNHLLDVDGTFGSVGSQTYKAVIAFQQAHGLQQDSLVGPATKVALAAALAGDSVATPTVPPATVTAPAAALPARASSIPWQMDPGDTLAPGSSIASEQNDFALIMQNDGNLVEYAPYNVVVASTKTEGNSGTVLFMQSDGNLVLRAPGNIPIWSSGTAGHPGTVLQIQSDGALVLYAPGHRVLRVLVPNADYVPTPAPGPSDPSSTKPHDGDVDGENSIQSLHEAYEGIRSNLYDGDYINMPGRPVDPDEDFLDIFPPF
jgi:peptidoglycan hydrolase-like protein with peptidoglycan-binding domain